ncbi:hypothetical protein HDU76_004337 [Blyttiomyces sp. JEL0837]|nr:hypothetical protein HDU76_004337 [Blyttiomyces sp. JEL0837]
MSPTEKTTTVDLEASAVEDKKFNIKDLIHVEQRGIEPVPVDAREQPSTFANFTMWFSANMVVTSFSLGTLAKFVFYLGFWDSFAAILLFNIMGILPVAFFSTFGPKFGMRQMVITRYSFGYYGTMFIGLLNIFACIGWSAVNVVVGGEVINAINSNVPVGAGIAIIAFLTTIVALFGYNYIHLYEKYAYIPMTAIFLVIFGMSVKYWDTSAPLGTGSEEAASVLSFGSSVFGFAVGWTAYAADYNCQQPFNASSVRIFFLTAAGLFIPLVFVEVLGLGVASAIANNQAYADSVGVGGLLAAVLAPLGGFGSFLMVLLALSIIANNVPNDYSLGLTVQIFGPIFEKVARYWWTLIGAVVYIAIAIPSVGRFNETLTNFLLIVAYWLAPYSCIMALEHLVFRKAKWPIELKYFGK